MKKIVSAVLLIQSLSFSALASPEMTRLFSDTYGSNYVARQCYQNVVRLLQLAEKQRLNINNANLLRITNKGFSALGLVNAEFARSKLSPTETNWEFHAVLELDGLIYDYDFGNRPVVAPVKEYFEKMFLNEKPQGAPSSFYVGREGKLRDYEVVILPGVEILRGKPRGETIRLGMYLEQF